MSVQAQDGQYDSVADPIHGGLMSGFAHWTGAILSVCLVLGLGVWSYQLTMRDVTEVPVIRAMEGKYRERPDAPGGEVAEHRGLAVNSVQSEGGVERPADRVVLAPDPVDLNDEDVALSYLRPSLRGDVLVDQPENLADVSASNEDEMEQSTADAINAAVLAAVEGAGDSAELGRIAGLPGVKRSPRPRARMLVAALTPRSQAQARATDADAGYGAVDVDASEVVTGARLVQLGAFDDRETAIREWDHILDLHGDLIGDRKRFIQEAESGGRSFFRLRMVGFDSLSDSRRLCSALMARGTPCIPVTAR